MGKRGPAPQKHVETIWSPLLAYAVGLIATDGCLSKDGRHIDFTSKDRALVRTFQKCLKLKNFIGRKTSGYTGQRDYFHIQFGDINFYHWLLGIGLSPRKSRIIGTLKVPDKFFFDFLRGGFDGDGTIYSFWDPRWHSSFMFYVAFTSASVDHLVWLRDTIRRLIGIEGKIKAGTRSYKLVYAKKASSTLIKKMFYADNIPHLQRKLLKIRKILLTNEQENARVLELVDSPG